MSRNCVGHQFLWDTANGFICIQFAFRSGNLICHLISSEGYYHYFSSSTPSPCSSFTLRNTFPLVLGKWRAPRLSASQDTSSYWPQKTNTKTEGARESESERAGIEQMFSCWPHLMVRATAVCSCNLPLAPCPLTVACCRLPFPLQHIKMDDDQTKQAHVQTAEL